MKKISAIILFVVQALPIPISLFSIFATLMSIAGLLEHGDPAPILLSIVALLTMILAGTYTITYITSFIVYHDTKKLSFVSFLPLIHLTVTIMFYYSWNFLDGLSLT